jgi:hypothetical protein
MTSGGRLVVCGATSFALALATLGARVPQGPVRPYEVPRHFAPPPPPAQPVPYSHKTHAGAGMPCQICHTNPDPGRLMGFPATVMCMSCHTAVAADRPTIVRLAELARSNEPVPWVRVYQVMPGVTWAHRPHVRAGIACDTCHGQVAAQEQMTTLTSVTAMASCIGCHDAYKAPNTCVTCHAWPDIAR